MCAKRQTVYLLCLIVVLVVEIVDGQDGVFFLKASKNIPRIGKRNKNSQNDENFEKFFLKASKSVPRIGRRGGPQNENNQVNGDVKYPTWSQLPDLFEFNPELFAVPELMRKFEDDQTLPDDPSNFDWDRIRIKRTNLPAKSNEETPEFRFQP